MAFWGRCCMVSGAGGIEGRANTWWAVDWQGVDTVDAVDAG